MTRCAAPGDPVRVVMTKWGERPHWEFDGLLLGTDGHGTWLGFPRGTHQARPGYAFDSPVDAVTLLPRAGWWLGTFLAPGAWCRTYVDIASPPRWDGPVVRSVDLDLDVVRLAADGSPPPAYAGRPVAPGQVYVDDEHEFAEHRLAFGYPAEVVARAEAACAEVVEACRRRTPPFDDSTPHGWLRRLRDLSA